MSRAVAALALALVPFALAGCETISAAPTEPMIARPPAPTRGLTGPIDFGDWRRTNAEAVLQRFSSHVNRRWPIGAPLSQAVADLASQGFACATPRARAGDPPDQACRRQLAEAGCTHIWTVSLYDDAGAVHLTRVRALYDKRCGRDGLAGGPD